MQLPFEQSLSGKRVLVTGHTGFTGSWASLWLTHIGAKVGGYALAPETNPSMFQSLGLEREMESEIGDICDAAKLSAFVQKFKPDAILHLAAQPLVRRSYREPVETFAVNALGTAHVLEAARHCESVRAVLCITTDKVYKNREWAWPYREEDPLGGKDPYSASKAAAEMIIDSYQASFGKTDGTGLAIATARGGNIVGGGDWSEDRLIPDFVRAVVDGSTMTLRYPDATRPWQHVLALVHGYFMLLGGLLADPKTHARAWNLGPQDPQSYSVRRIFEILSDHWTKPKLEFMSNPLPEAQALALDSSLAKLKLDWQPAWDTRRVIEETAAWYKGYYANPADSRAITLAQIERWRADAGATAKAAA